MVTGFRVSANTIRVYALTMLIALALSLVLVPMEHYVNKLRQRIAGKAKKLLLVGTAVTAVDAAVNSTQYPT